MEAGSTKLSVTRVLDLSRFLSHRRLRADLSDRVVAEGWRGFL